MYEYETHEACLCTRYQTLIIFNYIYYIFPMNTFSTYILSGMFISYSYGFSRAIDKEGRSKLGLFSQPKYFVSIILCVWSACSQKTDTFAMEQQIWDGEASRVPILCVGRITASDSIKTDCVVRRFSTWETGEHASRPIHYYTWLQQVAEKEGQSRFFRASWRQTLGSAL